MARVARISAFALTVLAVLAGARVQAQAALLLEQPYGLYGVVNPTGHNAIYLEHVCAQTPVKLRRCRPGELGSVISRYEGIDGYDWVAMPLIPYLYSVEHVSQVPARVTHDQVVRMRQHYREVYFDPIGLDRSGGNWVPNGWTQLVGAAYDRRIYAFRFDTTPEQDDELIARFNSAPNVSHFHMLYRNCADFARSILNIYFPHDFHRMIFPDAGITTPKGVTDKLVRYARKHPEIDMKVFEISQIPGYRRKSGENKDVVQSFVTTAYAIPITLISPYLTGGLFVDYIARGRCRLIPKNTENLGPGDLVALTEREAAPENAASAAKQAPGASAAAESPEVFAADSAPIPGIRTGLREIKAAQ
ncbi:MAG TPA: hypothetical protein VMA34_10820 [Terracidiphilus sp.]|nr:hypothetical protein [Terracidiphilus sp.]